MKFDWGALKFSVQHEERLYTTVYFFPQHFSVYKIILNHIDGNEIPCRRSQCEQIPPLTEQRYLYEAGNSRLLQIASATRRPGLPYTQFDPRGMYLRRLE